MFRCNHWHYIWEHIIKFRSEIKNFENFTESCLIEAFEVKQISKNLEQVAMLIRFLND